MKRAGAWLLLLLAMAVRADEAELQGFITDNTISRSGHEFYVRFCERLNDISQLDFNLAVKERPSARWGFWYGSSTRTRRCIAGSCNPMSPT